MSDQKTTLKVVSFSGSLRKGSINTAALRALKALAPADLAIDIFDLSEIPSTTTTCAPDLAIRPASSPSAKPSRPPTAC